MKQPLSTVARIFLLPWNALMTVACFTLFTWIVHDRRMPGWPDVLDRVKRGAWLDLAGGRVSLAVVLDVLLFALFGLIHAGFASRTIYQMIGGTRGPVHRQALRTMFMTVTAAAWLGVIFLWQPTGVLVVDSRPALARIGMAPAFVDTYGPLVPFAFVLLCLGTVVRHGVLRFLGIRQLISAPERTDEMGAYRDESIASTIARAPMAHGLGSDAGGARPRLLTTGMYGVVRHPMYLYLLASVVVRPVLSLDLVVWFLCAVVFLIIALPREERKLIAVFGEPYQDYQRRTPAFIPFWPARRPDRSHV